MVAWFATSVLAFAAAQAVQPANPARVTPGKFSDITVAAGIHFRHVAPRTSRKYLLETMAPGVALFDFDNDGRLDIFVTNGAPLTDPTPKGTIPQKTGPEYWNRLYQQKSDGTFEDVTEKAGLQGLGYGMGLAVGDYDNDGYEDLFVSAYGGNRLYHNNGNGTFTDVTESAGVGGGGWSSSAARVDLDNDGLLDLVVVRYVTWDFSDVRWGRLHRRCGSIAIPTLSRPSLFWRITTTAMDISLKSRRRSGYRSQPKGWESRSPITIATATLTFTSPMTHGLSFCFTTKETAPSKKWDSRPKPRSTGDGRTFADMGVDFADYNNDGLPDLVVDDLANQMYAL
jgi:enediyne biosynthesis protein E4